MAKIEIPTTDSGSPNAKLFWKITLAVMGLLAVIMLTVGILHFSRHFLCLRADALCLYDFPLRAPAAPTPAQQ